MGLDDSLHDGGATGQVSSYRLEGFCLWVYLGCMVFGDGVDVAPESVVGHTWCARDVTEAMVDDPGPSWWWGGWPLLHGRGCTGVVIDAVDHTAVFVLWGGLPG